MKKSWCYITSNIFFLKTVRATTKHAQKVCNLEFCLHFGKRETRRGSLRSFVCRFFLRIDTINRYSIEGAVFQRAF